MGTASSGNRAAVYVGPRCGTPKRNGEPCRAPAMANGRCRVHGGATPGGFASPHWETGRYSKYLGPALGPMVSEAMADPDRHSMEQELALVDARTAQLLQQLQGKDGPAAWTKLAEALTSFHMATRLGKGSGPAMAQAMAEVDAIVGAATGEAAAWAEILDLIDKRRILVESEEKRAVSSGRAIPVDQVLNLIASLTRAVLDDVPEPDRRRRISDRFRSIMLGRRLSLEGVPRALIEAGRA